MSFDDHPPFRRPDEDVGELRLRVEGRIPGWLRGTLIRTCPAVFSRRDWAAAHWFDGLGMLFSITFDDAPVLRWRLLESRHARRIDAGLRDVASFATPRHRPWWRRVASPVGEITDNTNVNIVALGDEWIALTETSNQLIIDPQTLAVIGPVAWEDGLADALTGAHPRAEGSHVWNVAARLGRTPGYSVLRCAMNDRHRRVVGTWETSELPYVHSFGHTVRHTILINHPFRMNARDQLWNEQGFIAPFKWTPSTGTQLVRIPHDGGPAKVALTEAMFVFHVVRAFEERDDTVVDVIAYPDPDIVDALCVRRLSGGAPPNGRYRRLRIRGDSVLSSELDAPSFEFPTTNETIAQQGPHHRCWGSDPFGGRVVSVDPESGAAKTHEWPDAYPGEPVFVARPGASAEDDGVLLVVAAHRSGQATSLRVLDAATLAPRAVITAEVSLPLGFHGTFRRASAR